MTLLRIFADVFDQLGNRSAIQSGHRGAMQRPRQLVEAAIVQPVLARASAEKGKLPLRGSGVILRSRERGATIARHLHGALAGAVGVVEAHRRIHDALLVGTEVMVGAELGSRNPARRGRVRGPWSRLSRESHGSHSAIRYPSLWRTHRSGSKPSP